MQHSGRLPRLAPEYYRGTAWVHWVMTLEHRATGWLDALHHARLREALLHALARHRAACPVYCLMPDHAHFLWLGLEATSDQRLVARSFRAAWSELLGEHRRTLHRQPFEHVLREHERERGAVQAAAHYILENPVRAGLADDWCDYPFSGCVVPGFFRLDPRDETFWERLWRILASGGDAIGGPGGPNPRRADDAARI